MSPKKVLLVGAGNIARSHAAALKDTPGVVLYGVFDANAATAEGLARDFHIPNVFDSLEQAAASEADTVHVLTPPDLHLATAMPFVQAGKTVLLEKPLGVSSAECAALRCAAAASGAVVGVNQNFVFNPAYEQLKKTIASGALGKPRYLSYVYEVPLRQLTARQLSGRVGELMDGISTIHALDTSNYERADMSTRLGQIFKIRYDLYQWKFLVKFINNFLAQVTPFLFYCIGGYLALNGRLDVGQLVADAETEQRRGPIAAQHLLGEHQVGKIQLPDLLVQTVGTHDRLLGKAPFLCGKFCRQPAKPTIRGLRIIP